MKRLILTLVVLSFIGFQMKSMEYLVDAAEIININSSDIKNQICPKIN